MSATGQDALALSGTPASRNLDFRGLWKWRGGHTGPAAGTLRAPFQPRSGSPGSPGCCRVEKGYCNPESALGRGDPGAAHPNPHTPSWPLFAHFYSKWWSVAPTGPAPAGTSDLLPLAVPPFKGPPSSTASARTRKPGERVGRERAPPRICGLCGEETLSRREGFSAGRALR